MIDGVGVDFKMCSITSDNASNQKRAGRILAGLEEPEDEEPGPARTFPDLEIHFCLDHTLSLSLAGFVPTKERKMKEKVRTRSQTLESG
jgi:hypothetical protein